MELYFVLYGRTEDLEGIDSHTRHASRAMGTRAQAELYAESISSDRCPIVVVADASYRWPSCPPDCRGGRTVRDAIGYRHCGCAPAKTHSAFEDLSHDK